MITIKQTVRVEADRQILVLLPANVPIGNARITIIVDSTPPAADHGTITTLWDKYGVLENSPNFNEDPVSLQRAMRDE